MGGHGRDAQQLPPIRGEHDGGPETRAPTSCRVQRNVRVMTQIAAAILELPNQPYG